MKVLIKKAKIFSPSSPFHGKSQDILIENGIISEIGNEINSAADTTIEIDGLHDFLRMDGLLCKLLRSRTGI